MIIQSVVGLLVFAGLAWLMSENRKAAGIKMALIGIVLQLLVGLVLLKLPLFRDFFLLLNRLLQVTAPAGSTKEKNP